eukprot:CAMPEP_0174251430 /NCGR_PEP_ID=MMETSP0439-20130205/1254_1 /TAXON_ID=0 /ORGANISM="Stereomyxa ramosa, Strain Chinc5" /LENGTH=299 /DNA_ID=CAMNT_0015331737 /DNA_START=314 /DNA_END=1213 /DNA_ORIENTATION=-
MQVVVEEGAVSPYFTLDDGGDVFFQALETAIDQFYSLLFVSFEPLASPVWRTFLPSTHFIIDTSQLVYLGPVGTLDDHTFPGIEIEARLLMLPQGFYSLQVDYECLISGSYTVVVELEVIDAWQRINNLELSWEKMCTEDESKVIVEVLVEVIYEEEQLTPPRTPTLSSPSTLLQESEEEEFFGIIRDDENILDTTDTQDEIEEIVKEFDKEVAEIADRIERKHKQQQLYRASSFMIFATLIVIIAVAAFIEAYKRKRTTEDDSFFENYPNLGLESVEYKAVPQYILTTELIQGPENNM